MKIPEALLQKYEFYEFLGEGGSGTVFKAFSFDKEQFIALKIIDFLSLDKKTNEEGFSSKELKEIIEREVSIHKELIHDNILKLYDSKWLKKENLFLIELELCADSLSSYLTNLGEEEARIMFYDICSAVEFLHKNNVLHRDLKPGNILITISKDNKKIIKLADFGGAKVQTLYNTRNKNTLHIGTEIYLPPEKLREETMQFTEATDIFALGIIYHQMLAGSHPFGKNKEAKNNIMKGKKCLSPGINSDTIEIINSKTFS